MTTTENELKRTETNSDTFLYIPLEAIDYSPTQPRKFIDPAKLQELADSITAHGVVEPIILRPHPKKPARYELVAGERRHRASIIAKRLTIPSIVRHYSDHQAAEVQQIENLQRADIHPLDEAHGFTFLIARFLYTPESIAAKIGKTPGYVTRRMALAKLADFLQKEMWKDRLPLGHAEYLCRLKPADQEALGKSMRRSYDDSLVSLKELQRDAERRFFRNLDSAPWKKNDVFVQGIPSCVTCPKRSGSMPLLFPEYAKQPNVCTDHECFKIKLDAFIDQKLIANPKMLLISDDWNKNEKGVLKSGTYHVIEKKADRCELQMVAVMADGNYAGHERLVCVDKKCPKHKDQIYRSSNDANAESKKWKAQRAADARQIRIDTAGRNAMFREAWTATKTKVFHPDDMRELAEYCWERAYNRRAVAMVIGWKPVKSQFSSTFDPVARSFIAKATIPELIKFIMLMVANEDLGKWGKAEPRILPAIAKRWGVDVLKARTTARKELEKKYAAKAKGAK